MNDINRIVRLLCSIVLLFAVTVSAGGMGHATGAHNNHMAAMSSVMDADASGHDHASHDMHAPSGNHDGSEPADLMSCCAAMSGACAGFVAYLPTATILQPALDGVPSYPLSDTYLSGVEPDYAQRPPRA